MAMPGEPFAEIGEAVMKASSVFGATVGLNHPTQSLRRSRRRRCRKRPGRILSVTEEPFADLRLRRLERTDDAPMMA